MPTEPQPVTLADVVRRGVEAVDPDGADPDVTDLLVRFEDADEPVHAIDDPSQTIAEGVGAIDPQEESGPVQVAAAIATYLAFRRDEVDEEDPDELVRLAVRAEFEGHPPDSVAEWLEENDIQV
jgi:hypothetical protein